MKKSRYADPENLLQSPHMAREPISVPGVDQDRPFVYALDSESLRPVVRIAHYLYRESGLDIPARIIDDFELVLVTGGEGDYVLSDRAFRVGRGCLILTPPFLKHSYRSAGKPFAHYAVHFDPAPGLSESFRPTKAPTGMTGAQSVRESCRKTNGMAATDAAADCRRRAEVRYIDKSGKVDIAIPPRIETFPVSAEYLFRELIERREASGPELQASMSLRTASIVLEILAIAVESSSCIPASSRPRLARAAVMMQDRFSEPLTVCALASVCGYAPNHFTTEFSASYGLSPLEYLIVRRISNARKLLASTDMSIKEISARCGYGDQYYFSRLFSKRTGMCPTLFRRLSAPDGPGRAADNAFSVNRS